jgi:hypothetical protein
LKRRRSAVPQTLNTIMIGLTVAVAIIMILRYIATWFRFQVCIEEGDENTMRQLVAEQNAWILRHGICVVAALIMVASIRYLPGGDDFAILAGSITTYAIMSFIFAFIESVMAQWLENRMAARQMPLHQVLDSE